jgi:hypothetical protein
MAHIALTSLCKDHLTATAALPIALLPIRDQENTVWPSLPRRDDFVDQVRAVPVQPVAQHRQDMHAVAYVSVSVRGEYHCHHRRDREAEA